MSSINHYVIDCNQLRRNDKIRSEVDVFVVLESDYDARDSEANAAQVELAALREELAAALATVQGLHEAGEFLDKVNQGVEDGLRKRLTATEQRNAELVELLEATRDARDAEQYTTKELRETLSGINALLVDLVSSPHAVVVPLELWKRIHNFVDISLKPTESGASE